MKKLVIALFVLGMALPSFAGIKVKDVVGTWSYKIETEYETMTGKLVFEKNGDGLSGEVVTDIGETFQMTKVEIRDNNVLYFELEVNYNVMQATITIEGKENKGIVAGDGEEMEVIGEKIK